MPDSSYSHCMACFATAALSTMYRQQICKASLNSTPGQYLQPLLGGPPDMKLSQTRCLGCLHVQHVYSTPPQLECGLIEY